MFQTISSDLAEVNRQDVERRVCLARLRNEARSARKTHGRRFSIRRGR